MRATWLVRSGFARAGILTTAMLLCAGAAPRPIAAEGDATTDLRAAFLYTLARFTEWPADNPAGPITLCVRGDDAVDEALVRLAGHRHIGGRTVAITRLGDPAQPPACHLLYLAGDAAALNTETLRAVASQAVLTVGDGEQFVRTGGVAALFMDGGRMRFAINPDAMLRARLRISSKLLGIARLLKDGDGQP
ncbi:MAG: YfiR family protein [Vicinamibacterales bacterium]